MNDSITTEDKDMGKISILTKIAIIVSVVAVSTVIYGFAEDNWAPLCYLILVLCLILFIYNLYGLLEDRLEKHLPLNPQLTSPPNGNIEVEIICTKYLLGNGPIHIEVNGNNIGKTHRGRSARILLPKGEIAISAYRDSTEMVIENGVIEDGSSLIVWCENGIPPKYRVAFIKKGEKFSDEKIIVSYKMARELDNSFTYWSMPLGIFGLISMIWILISFDYL